MDTTETIPTTTHRAVAVLLKEPSELVKTGYFLLACVLCALLYYLIKFLIKVYKEQYTDVLSVVYDGENKVSTNLCGGKQFFTVFDFRLCFDMMRLETLQERVVPPVLFENLLRTPHGTGICTSTGLKHLALKEVIVKMFGLHESLHSINWCAAQTLQTMGRGARNRSMPISLARTESWVTAIMMTILYDVHLSDSRVWGTDMRELENALDDLFVVREELGKLVYDMNLFNSIRRYSVHAKLLYKYNIAREEVVKKLKDGSYYRFTAFAELQRVTYPFEAEDILETYIDVLLYCKKQLGYAVYRALYEMAAHPKWQTIVKTFIHQPRDRTSFYRHLEDSNAEDRKILVVIFEVLRLSEQRLCCHLRKATSHFRFPFSNIGIIPKGSVCHLARWSERDHRFWPELWFVDHDIQKEINGTMYFKMAPFGDGKRNCPAQGLSFHVTLCLLAHVLRTGTIEQGTEFSVQNDHTSVVFNPREHFDPPESLEYLREIGNFRYQGIMP